MSLMTIGGYTKSEITGAVEILRDQLKLSRHQEDVARRERAVADSMQQRRRSASPLQAIAVDFWNQYRLAKQAITIACGPNWHLHTKEYRWATVPKKYTLIKGHAAARHKMPSDIKVPNAKYWSEERIPPVGLIFATFSVRR